MTHPIITRTLLVLKGSLRVVKFIFSVVAGVVLISTAMFVGIYFFFARDLPDIKTIDDYRPPVISQVFADDGKQIGEFWLECRIFTPFNEIPKRVIQAFVDSEDARFFEHKGVDIRSIIRAFVANLQAGSVTQGGSTITQQITRSLLLTREKSVTRKAREAILATRIERYLSKEQILTLYLNQIYLGNRAYGVAAAARNYFKKDLADLNLAQIALLGGLPTAPTNFSPVVNPEEARKRQVHVLGRMLEAGHITKDEMKKALAEEFPIYVAGTDKDFNDKDAAWFVEHVRRIVKEKYGDEVLYNKGLKIYTTVNMPMQRAANLTIRRAIETMDRKLGYRGAIGRVGADETGKKAAEIGREIAARQGLNTVPWPPSKETQPEPVIEFVTGDAYQAVVTAFRDKDTFIQIGNVSGVIKQANLKWARSFVPGSLGYEGGAYVNDPKTLLKVGDIIMARKLEDGTFMLAQDPMIQSALVAMDVHSGYIKAMVGGYDFSKSEFNRATQALRQPGSSFKPFVYSSALDKGYTEDTQVVDGPVSFKVGDEVWTPKNYGGDYYGAMTFKNCIVQSRNLPTAKIVYDIGTHYLTAFERKLGMTSPIGKYLSMALGANSVYLLEMVQAYTVFADHGIYKPAVAITKIEDVKGNIIESYEFPTKEQEAIAEEKLEEEASASSSKIGKAVVIEELNRDLWLANEHWLKEDKLNLTDLEIKTLYGANIPKGHAITPQTAYIMVDMMKAVVDHGTGTRAKLLGKPAAGKTGTTNDETDVWFIGYVPDLSAGVWMGYDEVQKIGPRVTGGVFVAPIWTDFMKLATEGWEAKDFDKPADFPEGKIETLAGGSSLFGSEPKTAPSGGGFGGWHDGADRAGKFFDEDFENFH